MKYLLLIFVLLVASSCENGKSSKTKPVQRAVIEFKKEAELSLFDKEGEVIKTIDIEIAETPYEQETGLMYREEMENHQGMLFTYEDERPRPSFYMKNTKIALDLIYFDKDFKVVDFNLNTLPMDESLLSSKVPSQYVLEVVAGFVEEFNIQLGTHAQLKRLE